MNKERGVGCAVMLGAVLVAFGTAQANSEATPVGLFLAFAVFVVGFIIFMISFG